ncbi:AAA family ATPase, partial [Klebsiella pneumoniae]
MINSYKLKNFKSFDSAKLAFTKLNVLSGINGSGKSSVIQSLLLLKSYYDYQSSDYNVINLNNNYCQLGKVQDVFHE